MQKEKHLQRRWICDEFATKIAPKCRRNRVFWIASRICRHCKHPFFWCRDNCDEMIVTKADFDDSSPLYNGTSDCDDSSPNHHNYVTTFSSQIRRHCKLWWDNCDEMSFRRNRRAVVVSFLPFSYNVESNLPAIFIK